MGKNVRLADIYIKIYNKQTLTLDDLTFLAKYDRECFEKTCRNLLYNIPQAKEIMQPEQKQDLKDGESTAPEKAEGERQGKKPDIRTLLENLKKMEWQELEVQNVNADDVKNLLGNLYMEKLFPHNDKHRYFRLEDFTENSFFNKKA